MTMLSDRGPKILVFPSVLPLLTLLLGVEMQWLLPLQGLARLDASLRTAIGLVLLTAGTLVLPSGVLALRYADTAVNPTHPVTALVMRGAFALTRNPIYLGGSLFLVGIGFLFGLDWVVIFWAASLPLLHYGIVLREEAYLEAKFGDAYRAYRQRVPRYLWPWR